MRRCLAILSAVLLLAAASCDRGNPSVDAMSTERVTALPVTQADTTEAATDTTTELPTEPQTTQLPPPETRQTEKRTTAAATHPDDTPTSPADADDAITAGPVAFGANFVRVYGSWSPAEEELFPQSVVLDSRAALDAFLQTMTSALRGESVKKELQNATLDYTDEWFGTRRLIALALQESSGSIGHVIRKVTLTGNGVDVEAQRTTPEVQTCDVAQWVIFIEVADTHLRAGDPVRVTWTDQVKPSRPF